MQELLILGVLLREKMHGYQLGEYVSHAMSPFTTIKKPTIYYTLDKLEKNGYVHQESEREGNRPERRVYEITNKGKFHFLKERNQFFIVRFFETKIIGIKWNIKIFYNGHKFPTQLQLVQVFFDIFPESGFFDTADIVQQFIEGAELVDEFL